LRAKLSLGLGAAASVIGAASPASATTPRTLWRGVDRLIVSCSSETAARSKVADEACAEVLRDLQRDSPYPVFAASDAGALTARDVVLQVRLTSEPASAGSGQSLFLSIVPVRDDPRAETSMASAEPVPPSLRRAVGGAAGDELAKSVSAQLDRVLPWRSNIAPGRARQ
jgi:hypothetical protein